MAESNAYELARVQEALASELGELGISLAVERGRVYLGGVVGTEERRQRIAAIVRAALPQHEIVNDLGVQRLGAPATESFG